MDELTEELKRAGAHLQGTWDKSRIEGSLSSAKRRRVRRVAVRSSAAALGALALAFLFLRGGSDTPSVAVKPPIETPRPAPVAPMAPPSAPEEAPRMAETAPAPTAPPEEVAPAPVENPKARAQGKIVRVQNASSEFRAKLASGDARGAYAILVQERPLLSSIDDLMLAADAARRSGDAARAADWLDRAVREHPGARSAVAAYTLGKLLQDDLARPADAARAFALVYARSPDAPLASEALAREALALKQSGDGARAKAQAATYLARYPQGAQRTRMEQVLRAP